MPSVSCLAASFRNILLHGAQVNAITTNLVTNYTPGVSPAHLPNYGSVDVHNVTFCNVTISYSLPGANYNVTVETWLPSADDGWNGRLQAQGGGGFGAGRFSAAYAAMAAAVSLGYATASTDGGSPSSVSVRQWLLAGPGTLDTARLRVWASTSLNHLSILAKAVVAAYYGRPAEYAYWNGCSQGGRQGYALAQQFPHAFDGIAAAAPAIYWPQWDPAVMWAQHLMNQMSEYPRGCEFDALTMAAVQKCDSDDGLVDGLLSDPAACTFDPFALVGREIWCPQSGQFMKISDTAATIANATWSGPHSQDRKLQWFGPYHGSDLSGIVWGGGPASTICNRRGVCRGYIFPVVSEWVQIWVYKDPSYNISAMDRDDWDDMMRRSSLELDEYMASASPNLTEFHSSGGKLLSIHGLADGIIPPQGTEKYYKEVVSFMNGTQVDSFYRYFPVPGLSHCYSGFGGYPTTAFDALRAWVENGTAPDALPISLLVGGKESSRVLCPYPKMARFDQDCGDATLRKCFSCG